MSDHRRMDLLTSAQVEQIFLEYYRGQGYALLPGSSLLDDSVPMSFVMSAGLVQIERAASTSRPQHERFALVQNCFRHFDLDLIGTDDLHLSLFRMAGAFTFGSSLRREQIPALWGLIHQAYGLPPEKLWVTYFSGDAVAGVRFPADSETGQGWLEAGVMPGHLIALGGEANFWKQSALMMGSGHAPKCGPNTEVFYDRGENRSCGPGCLPGCNCGRFVEFMNTLFIAWSLDPGGGELSALAEPFTETVIGVERLAMLLQAAGSVFETDTFQPLLELVRAYAQGRLSSEAERVRQERRLVDHLRALLFLVADGAPGPSKRNARAFLMQKLVRGVLTGMKILDLSPEPFLSAIFEKTAALQPRQNPDLAPAQATLNAYIADESQRFEHTLQAASRQLERLLASLPGRSRLRGEDVLALEKRYGMPLDLLNLLLRAKHIRYSRKAYRLAREHWQAAIVKAQGL